MYSSPNLLGTMPEPTRQTLYCSQHENGPTLSHKMSQGRKKHMADRDPNPEPLAYLSSTESHGRPVTPRSVWLNSCHHEYWLLSNSMVRTWEKLVLPVLEKLNRIFWLVTWFYSKFLYVEATKSLKQRNNPISQFSRLSKNANGGFSESL